jgi:hypothetical protein
MGQVSATYGSTIGVHNAVESSLRFQIGRAFSRNAPLAGVAADLPLNRHPAAIRASAVCVTPWGAG